MKRFTKVLTVAALALSLLVSGSFAAAPKVTYLKFTSVKEIQAPQAILVQNSQYYRKLTPKASELYGYDRAKKKFMQESIEAVKAFKLSKDKKTVTMVYTDGTQQDIKKTGKNTYKVMYMDDPANGTDHTALKNEATLLKLYSAEIAKAQAAYDAMGQDGPAVEIPASTTTPATEVTP